MLIIHNVLPGLQRQASRECMYACMHVFINRSVVFLLVRIPVHQADHPVLRIHSPPTHSSLHASTHPPIFCLMFNFYFHLFVYLFIYMLPISGKTIIMQVILPVSLVNSQTHIQLNYIYSNFPLK